MENLRKYYNEKVTEEQKALVFLGIGVVLGIVAMINTSFFKYILLLISILIVVSNALRLLFIKNIIGSLLGKNSDDDAKKSIHANVAKFRGLFLRVGYIISVMIILLAFNWREVTKVSSLMGDLAIPEELEVDIPPTEQKKPPPPPPPPPQLEILEDDEIIEEEPEIEEVEIDEETEIEIPDIPEEESTGEAEIFMVVEEMPEYPGGINELNKYIARNIRYPSIARENGVSGRVFVSFVVEPTGDVSNVKILRGIGAGCDEEAIRVVKSLPKWKPGKQRGKPVRVSFNVPINFQLN